MMTPKRRLLTLIFACLCFKKSLLTPVLKVKFVTAVVSFMYNL